MAIAQPQRQEPLYMAEKEYLEFERQSQERHEFADGKVLFKEPGGWNHGVIAVNTASTLHQCLEDLDCVLVSMMMRLRIDPTNSYRYPDIMVICGKPQLLDEHQDNILNPKVIIEVLQPETELEDRTTRLQEYLTIDSLQEYLLISQDEARIERYLRQTSGDWLYSNVRGRNAHLTLPSIGVTLDFASVYKKVRLKHEESGNTGE